ncbi:MOSC domain-containing protein [Pseudogulbenkiania ferrooxidans]|uniref:MOSC domain containing protein n=1 Tax=Pseudogulbenkiania ferrooxidans 2002 TaxID=279714 RepID=B9Z8F9_9NEIS|nr:MOSC domain-containing protein [Pseudogulbenkiania ferrooxidans]EEG06897.1 MOSC domain containing protein [Pseudogulbenkiania ferrooxidans 2002]
MQLASMYVHPLKSARGIPYARAFASWQGLLHDREWLLTDEAGRFITARDYPQLLTIRCTPIPGAILLQAPDAAPIAALATEFDTPSATSVWKDHFTAYHGSPRTDAWFSRYLGIPCRLLWLGCRSHRKQKTSEHGLSFADGYPYLLVNQSSLDELNTQLPQPVTQRHFRPNLVVSGATPYEEDDWKVVRIGAVIFDVAKPCTRCTLTTVNPDNGMPSPDGEPLATLIKTRQLPEGICFGVNLVPRNEGILQLGDPFEVLELRYTF